MKSSFQIGRIFGISIRIDYSWFIIFALVSLSLGGSYFPDKYANWSSATYWIVGILTATIVFGSVLAHELAHSLVSKASGVPVDSITLFIFGGMARIMEESRSPGSEFLMALAGPAMSLVIAVIFMSLYLVMGDTETPLAALALWLSRINVGVAIFNLIPGFPLDGGRIFRSVVWKISGNLRKATRIAYIFGRIVIFLFILWGIWEIRSGYWLNGIWIIFIGWFLQRAASSSYRQLAMVEALRSVKVSEVMVNDCPRLPGDLSIKELVEDHILSAINRCFPVVAGDRVLGIVDLGAVREIPRGQWEIVRVEEVITSLDRLKSVRPDDNMYTVSLRMAEENVDQILVVEDGKLFGIVTRNALVELINSQV